MAATTCGLGVSLLLSSAVLAGGVPLPGENAGAAATTGVRPFGSPPLSAHLIKQDIDTDVSDRIDQLLNCALARNEGTTDLDRAVAKYSSRLQRSRFSAKDLSLNYFGFPRGFDASIEGAGVALDQTNTVKSLQAAVYAKQLRIDRLHSQIVAALLQLSSALGCREANQSQQQMQRAMTSLEQLVGSEEAARTVDMLVCWSRNGRLPESFWRQSPLDVLAFGDKIAEITELAMRNDLSMNEVRQHLHRIHDRSRGHCLSGKAVEGTVSAITMLGPGLGVPVAAQAVGAAWGVANGGSEESKLLQEVYYEKQLANRRQTLHAEAELALFARNEALRSRNDCLLLCSEAILAQLVGASGLQLIIDAPAYDHRLFVNRTIAGSAGVSTILTK